MTTSGAAENWKAAHRKCPFDTGEGRDLHSDNSIGTNLAQLLSSKHHEFFNYISLESQVNAVNKVFNWFIPLESAL